MSTRCTCSGCGSNLENRGGLWGCHTCFPLVAEVEKLRAENAELRHSVATMACDHKGIGLPDCRICDPRTKPGAGT